MKKFRMYVVDIDNDGSEYRVVFEEKDTKYVLKVSKALFCVEDVFMELYNFYKECCESISFDSRSMKIDFDFSNLK